MFRNYWKIATRNLWRNKSFSAINIFGLTIGLATCLLILLYIQSELSYDRYNKKADRIVRVVLKGMVQGEKLNEANVMPPTAAALKADYPEVLEATRLRNVGYPRISFGDNTFKEDAFAYADSNFLEVFTIPLLQGDTRTALSQPNSVIISRAVAQKYFGSENPMGKSLTFKDFNNTSYKITGVFDKIPVNSHFHFDLFGSMNTLADSRNPSWLNSNYFTYLVLPEGYPYRRLEAKLPQVVKKYIAAEMQQAMGITLNQMQQKGNQFGLFLQPLTDIHLHSDLSGELSATGDIRYIYIFGAIALFMLLIACINFMNLSTAGASKRAREVGIRKVMGSLQRELIGQFLLESILLTAIAMGLALALVSWILPLFNDLSGKQLSLQLTANAWVLPGLFLLVLLVGALAGSYPAFFLSSFKPVMVLKDNRGNRRLRTRTKRGTKLRRSSLSTGRNSIGLRSGLVVFQFFISITLMVSTAVVYQQLNFIQHKKLGYDKDQVLLVHEPYWLRNNQEAFRQRLLADPRVLSVSSSGYLPAGNSYNNNFFIYPESNTAQLVKALRYDVDDQYIPTLGMEMVAGRNFSRAFGTDSTGAIVNETAARALGWGANALGHTISNRVNGDKALTYRIIGIVKDFHFKSLRERISPLVMVLGANDGAMIVKTKTKDVAPLLTTLKKEWTALKADAPFAYSFLDERFRDTYQSEQSTGLLLGIFAGLTIFVACLGLFGLTTFTAEQRTKEIGIRKVLGSSVTGIVSLLSKDFVKLVVLAFLIAAPVAAWAMHQWLQDFAYRIDISGWVFVLAALLALVITIATISYQAIRAALANPVESLRAE